MVKLTLVNVLKDPNKVVYIEMTEKEYNKLCFFEDNEKITHVVIEKIDYIVL